MERRAIFSGTAADAAGPSERAGGLGKPVVSAVWRRLNNSTGSVSPSSQVPVKASRPFPLLLPHPAVRRVADLDVVAGLVTAGVARDRIH